jgi:hypothetical protein
VTEFAGKQLDLNREAKSGNDWSACAFKYTFCHPGSTTLSILKISFESSLGTHRLSLPVFGMTFPLLVGLKSANPSDFATCYKITALCFMQATCLSSTVTGFIY